MLKKADDIESSLQLCQEMDSPSVVIPVSIIEKYFPAKRHPKYPNVPSYDLGELQEWAKEKGWSIALASTGTTKDRRLVPGIRFSPLREIDAEQNAVAKPPNKEPPGTNIQKSISLTKIAEATIAGVFAIFIIYLIWHYFGIQLYG